MTTMMGYTTAPKSVGHYILSGTLYPILTSFCTIDVIFTEELRDISRSWRGRTALLLKLRTIFNILMVSLFLVTIPLAFLAQLVFIFEKVLWVSFDIVTIRLMSFTSLERSTQEMMEVLHNLFSKLPVKQLRLEINAQCSRQGIYNYRVPYIERGTYTKYFMIQFEFADPGIRNEALSILEFNNHVTNLPVFFSSGERRVFVFSPFGAVERLTVVQMLKLYTDEHSSVAGLKREIATRWHDVNNHCVREFVLGVQRCNAQHGTVSVGLLGELCVADMQIVPGSDAVAVMVNALRGLNHVVDIHRTNQGLIHLTGVTAARVLLSSLIIGATVLYYGVPSVSHPDGLKRYGMLISLWGALQAWGFNTWLGDNRISLSTLLDDSKLAVVYGAAHGSASRNFSNERRSWSMQPFDGSNQLPDINVLELFFGTHTAISKDMKAYQASMSESFIQEGNLIGSNASPYIRWRGSVSAGMTSPAQLYDNILVS